MTAAWCEMLPDRTQQDRKAWVQFGLALIGGGLVLGSLTGAAWGWARSWCFCCTNEELR